MSLQNATKVFLWIAVGLLVTTATLKFVSAASHVKLLYYYDPVLGQKNRMVYIGAACFELLVAGYVIVVNKIVRKLFAILWLCINFLIYHLGLLLLGVQQPCSCLGNPAAWWPWLGTHQGSVTWVVLLFLLLGSLIFFALHLRILNNAGGDGIRHSANPSRYPRSNFKLI